MFVLCVPCPLRLLLVSCIVESAKVYSHDCLVMLCRVFLGVFQDEEGAAYSALGFSNGFDPRLPGDKKLNPYLRLLPMLAGIG